MASKPEVYLVKPGKTEESNLLEGSRNLYRTLGLRMKKDAVVAVKLHFGEPGSTSFLRPVYAGAIVDEIKRAGGKPFLTDTNTLYVGSRSNAVEHVMAAMGHGFVPPVVDAPVIIGDGLHGREQTVVEFSGGKHLKRALLGSIPLQSDALVVLSHFKGHEMTGFGGALKNLGMGMGSRAGKEMMHGDTKLAVNPKKCIGCGMCVRYCPTGAVRMQDGKAVIDLEPCIGCGECLSVCPERAIKGGRSVWGGSYAELQEKMVEYAFAVLQGMKSPMLFFNYVMDITPRCDCLSWSEEYIAPDLGILASRDPVALDQACVDLVNEKAGRDVFRKVNGVDWSIQLEHAEKLGLGTRGYGLKQLSPKKSHK